MKKLLLLLIIPFLSFGQCVDGDFDNDGICDEVDDCVGTWIADITTGNCDQFTSQGADVCGSYSGCEWTYSWGGWVTGGSSDCVGSYEIDNGYCDELEFLIFGCMDESACNYDELATEDDGSCVFSGSPCGESIICFGSGVDLTAVSSGVLNDMCECIIVVGCNNPEACNYVPTATNELVWECTPMLQCIIPGEAFSGTYEFDIAGNITIIDACEEISEECECCYIVDENNNDMYEYVCGCMDENALNYDPDALLSNNSCIYSPVNISEEISNKNLITTLDILGRETNNNKGFQLHIYDDGTVEKKYVIK